MNRRRFLHTLLSGVAGSILSHELDIDRLLWIPGQRTIFLPSEYPWIHDPSGLAQKEIISLIAQMELERIVPKIKMLFERDNTFYEAIRRTNVIDTRTVGGYVGVNQAHRDSHEES